MNQKILKYKDKYSFLIVEDHETVLNGTLSSLRSHFFNSEFDTCTNVKAAFVKLKKVIPDLLLVDLSLPLEQEGDAESDIGIQFLRDVMQDFPRLNITIQSSHTKDLARLVHEIESHEGGFTVVSKSLTIEELLSRIQWSLDGLTHTKDVEGLRTGLAMRPEWIEVLKLAFEEGLQDKAIAQQMHLSERTIRLYWTKIYDVLEIYPEDERSNNRNIRIQALKKAQKLGLID